MGKRQIEAVLFDLGETLLNFGRVNKTALLDEALHSSYKYLKKLSQPVGSYWTYRFVHLWGIRWHLLRSWITGDDFNSLELLKSYGRRRDFQLDDAQWEELNWQWYKGLSKIGQVEPQTADTLRELSAAARSIHLMADYLERHPDALIYGKGVKQ